MKENAYHIPLPDGGSLHLKRFCSNEQGEPVFLLHGSIENGKIFYSKSGKGLGPYLASQGYDVYVGDMQGRGESLPAINRNSKYGQVDVIKTDIPLFLQKIKDLRGDIPIHIMAHSWGGVLVLAYLSRFENKVSSVTLFGSKRQLTVRSWAFWKQVFLFWYVLGSVFVIIYGYLPALKFGIGSDNEPRNHLMQINAWLKPKSKWIDNVDDFDYGKALREKQLPPCLFLAGEKDEVLGHPKDVKLLQEEVKNADTSYWLMAKSEGFLQDYDHINMLTHKDAVKDTFPKVVAWMNKLKSE